MAPVLEFILKQSWHEMSEVVGSFYLQFLIALLHVGSFPAYSSFLLLRANSFICVSKHIVYHRVFQTMCFDFGTRTEFSNDCIFDFTSILFSNLLRFHIDFTLQ